MSKVYSLARVKANSSEQRLAEEQMQRDRGVKGSCPGPRRKVM